MEKKTATKKKKKINVYLSIGSRLYRVLLLNEWLMWRRKKEKEMSEEMNHKSNIVACCFIRL
jgi:hypothetical protein